MLFLKLNIILQWGVKLNNVGFKFAFILSIQELWCTPVAQLLHHCLVQLPVVLRTLSHLVQLEKYKARIETLAECMRTCGQHSIITHLMRTLFMDN